jgi:DNA mismatch endonuclease (patch repair protein)
VIDVRGCFWHGCQHHRTIPVNNHEWWADKMEANRRRDSETERLLRESGWQVIVVWEHDDMNSAADFIQKLVQSAPVNGRP